MKKNNKQELSYFRLKLKSYMSEHHPEKLYDTEFITARAEMALTAYCICGQNIFLLFLFFRLLINNLEVVSTK